MSKKIWALGLMFAFACLLAAPVFAEEYVVPGLFRFAYPVGWTIYEEVPVVEGERTRDIAWFDGGDGRYLYVGVVDLTSSGEEYAEHSLYPLKEATATLSDHQEALTEILGEKIETLLTHLSLGPDGMVVPFLVMNYYDADGRNLYASTSYDGCDIYFFLYRDGAEVIDEDLNTMLDIIDTYQPILD